MRASFSMLVNPDPDALGGIAMRGAQGMGAWQYSLDGGLSYEDVGTVDEGSSLLLRETDRLRYVSAAEEDEHPGLVLVGWDQPSGAAGAKVDTTARGGGTAFSRAAATVIVGAEPQQPPRDRIVRPGDANEDLQFDVLDLVMAHVAGKYGTGMPATRAEGD